MKEPRTQRTEQVNTAQQDHSANYLFLIIGTPLVAFLIAASAMLESRGFPVPLVRIGTGAAGLILQAIPFMLLGAMMSAAVSTFVSANFLARHIPKSLAGGLAAALVTGLCLPVCDCMVGSAGDESNGDMVHMGRIHRQTMDGGGPRGVGHGSGDSRGGVVRGVAAPLPCGA